MSNNTHLSAKFEYVGGEKDESTNLVKDIVNRQYYFTAEDANDIADKLNLIIFGLNNSNVLVIDADNIIKIKVDNNTLRENENHALSVNIDNQTIRQYDSQYDSKRTIHVMPSTFIDNKTIKCEISVGSPVVGHLKVNIDNQTLRQYEDGNAIHVMPSTFIDNQTIKCETTVGNPVVGHLKVNIDNDTLTTNSSGQICVNEGNQIFAQRFLCSSLITNSKTLKFDNHGTNNITDDSLEINTSGLHGISFDNNDFSYNELNKKIELSETIKTTLDKAENMPTYLSPTNNDIYIFVDENYKSTKYIKNEQINIFDPDNDFGKMTLNGISNTTYKLSGLNTVTSANFTSAVSSFFNQLNTLYGRTTPTYQLLPDTANDIVFYDSAEYDGLFQLAWLMVLNECCIHSLKTFYICNDLSFAIDLCRTFSTTTKINYNIILMSEIDYFKTYGNDKDGSKSVREWEIPDAKVGGNKVQIYSCVEFVRRMFYSPDSLSTLHKFINDKIIANQDTYFTVKQMKHTAFILQDFISQIYPHTQCYFGLYSNIAFYGVWFVEAVRKDRVLHYISSYNNVDPMLSSSNYGYR